MAQTDDGYLWDGTYAGLFRFDGAEFERMSSLGGQNIANLPVQVLIPEPGGGLWIGYAGGAGSGHYKAGRYTALSPASGWANLVSGAVDGEGVLWANLDGHLARVDGEKARVLDADPTWGLPNARIEEVVIDKAGTIWVSSAGNHDLMYLPRGEKRFRWIGQAIGAVRLTAAPDGTIFSAGTTGLWAVLTLNGRPSRVVRISTRRFSMTLADRDGGLFASDLKKIFHVGDIRQLFKPGGENALLADSFTLKQEEGLSPPLVSSMKEDNEGNVWLATTSTLERFSDSPFTSIRFQGDSFTFGVVPGDNGAVWAANWTSNLLKIEHQSRVSVLHHVGPSIDCIYRDGTGSIWAAGPTGLWHSDEQGHFSRVSIPLKLLQPWVANMTLDASGQLWFETGGLVGHLVRGTPGTGKWRELTPSDGVGDRPSARAMMTDSAGRVWLSQGDTVIRVEDGSPRALSSLSAALKVGTILTFAERGRRIWVGGVDGLAVVQGEHVLRLNVRHGVPFNRVAGIVETQQGDLWVRGADDAWHVPADELRQALGEGRAEVLAEHFDALDGLGGMALNAKMTMTPSTDGLIWFGTRQGLAWIDPQRTRPPAPVPARHVDSVTVDGQFIAAARSVTLPALAHHLEISYTAIELGYPERIQFRYKLEGFDREWQFAGSRRTAFYNDLPPGHYRFRVTSTDRDGVWRDEGEAVMDIHASPAWFQKTAFKVGSALLVLFMSVLTYRLRMRHVARRMRLRLDEQLAERDRIAAAKHAERERIARDLHDTLLQSMQGVILGFQGLAYTLPEQHEMRRAIEGRLDHADQMLGEARDRVRDLRGNDAGDSSLRSAFEQLAFEMTWMVRLCIVEEGRPRELRAFARECIYLIGREALLNAVTHANCTAIDLRLQFMPRRLILTVHDDGIGIDRDILAAGSRPGHFGLLGMRERAEQLGAALAVARAPGGGTDVVLDVPASQAFQSAKDVGFWRRLRLAARRRLPPA